MKPDSETLTNLVVKDFLSQLSADYCRAIDRADLELLKSIWHEDATCDFGFFAGPALGFCELMGVHIETMERCFHFVSNERYQITGNVAHGETYVIGFSTSTVEDGKQNMLTGGRYLDRFECRNSIWKIANRTFVLDWEMAFPHESASSDFTRLIKHHGKRDSTDFSYQVLKDI